MHHKVREIFLVQDGRGKITINKKKFLAKKGDIFLIQPGDFHALSNSIGKAFVINIFKWNEDRKDIFWTKK